MASLPPNHKKHNKEYTHMSTNHQEITHTLVVHGGPEFGSEVPPDRMDILRFTNGNLEITMDPGAAWRGFKLRFNQAVALEDWLAAIQNPQYRLRSLILKSDGRLYEGE